MNGVACLLFVAASLGADPSSPIAAPIDEPVQAWVFGMKNCQPCVTLHDRISAEMEPIGWRTAVFEAAASRSAHVVYLRSDRQTKEVIQHKVTTFPTIVIFSGGKEVWRHVGLISADELSKTISEFQRAFRYPKEER